MSLFINNDVDAMTWHRRLGHLSFGKMKMLEDKESLIVLMVKCKSKIATFALTVIKVERRSRKAILLRRKS